MNFDFCVEELSVEYTDEESLLAAISELIIEIASDEKIMDNVNLIAQSDDPKTIVSRCDQIEESANKLILLQEAYSLEPSSELVDLVSKYREMKQKALSAMQK